MGLGTVKEQLFHHLRPTRRMNPGALGVNVLWCIGICLTMAFLALTPVAALPGVGFEGYTTLFVTAAGIALIPLLANLAGIWLLYSYLYLVTAPVVRTIDQGRPLAQVAISVTYESLLRTLIRLVYASARLLGIFGHEPKPLLTSSLLRFLRLGIPAHLALGWRAGSNPRLIYS